MTTLEMISALGSIGEFVGSLAVLVTLIYLAVQIKQAREQQALATLERRTESVRDQNLLVASTPSLVAALSKARAAVGEDVSPFVSEWVGRGLTVDEAMQVNHYLIATFRVAATQYMTIRDQVQAAQNDAMLQLTYGRGLGAVFWKHHVPRVATAIGPFREHVERLLAQPRD